MASLNKVQLIGNCGKDPEMRYLPSGMAMTSISIATSSKRKDKNSGQVIEETAWHRVQFFDKLAEIVGEYIRKGSTIYVEGRLKYGDYTDKDGVKRYTTDIVADSMQMLGGRDRQEAPQQAAPQRPAAPSQPAPAQRAPGGFEDMDDDLDIPF